MFADFMKWATRTAVAVGIVTAIIVPFAAIHIPNVDYTLFSTAIGKGYALMVHWIPSFAVIWNFTLGVFTFWLLVQTARLALIVHRLTLRIFS